MVAQLLLASVLHLFLACAVLGQLGAELNTQASSLQKAKAGSLIANREGRAVSSPEARTINPCAESKYPEFWNT